MPTPLPSKKGRIPLVPITLGGAALAAAFVTHLVLQWLPTAPAAQPEAQPRPAPRAQPAREMSDATAVRLLALENRMTELAAKSAPAPEAPPEPAPQVEAGPPALPDPKEQLRQVHEAFEQQVTAALREPADMIWSSRTGHTLQSELHSLKGEAPYQVSKIDCRTHSCVAELRFPSESDARTHLSRLVIQTNLQGCASTGHIDPSEDPSSPSRMRLLFHCARAREAR